MTKNELSRAVEIAESDEYLRRGVYLRKQKSKPISTALPSTEDVGPATEFRLLVTHSRNQCCAEKNEFLANL